MSIHLEPAWLMIASTFGALDIGQLSAVIGLTGLAGLLIVLAGAILLPSWRLLWLLLPLAATHLFVQIIGVWRIGDHHEPESLTLYAAGFVAALTVATWQARGNRLALAGAWIFSLAYGWFSLTATLFVFWNELH
jgi:hypothetical protein